MVIVKACKRNSFRIATIREFGDGKHYGVERNPRMLPKTTDLVTGLKINASAFWPSSQSGEGRTEDLVGHQFRREQPLEDEAFA
jgi:hypothetical protein